MQHGELTYGLPDPDVIFTVISRPSMVNYTRLNERCIRESFAPWRPSISLTRVLLLLALASGLSL